MRGPDHQATPMNAAAFATLSLRPELLASIATLAYDSMTPVQAQALPHLLSGKDLIAQAKTGSAHFVFPPTRVGALCAHPPLGNENDLRIIVTSEANHGMFAL